MKIFKWAPTENPSLVHTWQYTVTPGCSDYLLMINNRITYTVALPSGLAVPAYLGSGAALATAVFLGSQPTTPSLPSLNMYNNVGGGYLRLL